MLKAALKWMQREQSSTKKAKTFDYSTPQRRWGHDISFRPLDGGMKLRANGWGPSPEGCDELKREWMEPGDFIILSHPGGQETARYRIDEIKYMSNPSDQWFAELSFAPRPTLPASAQADENTEERGK